MPIYLFSNPKTNKIKHIFQEMNAEHTYSEDGVVFERVYTVPNATIDSQIDPFSSQKFIEKTGTMKGTLGEIWDYSKELSDKRAKSTNGQDDVRIKAENKYSKKRRGMKYKEKMKPSEVPQVRFDS